MGDESKCTLMGRVVKPSAVIGEDLSPNPGTIFTAQVSFITPNT